MTTLSQTPSVVVAVGTDHHPFDRLVRWIDDWAGDNPDVEVLVQRGTSLSTSRCPSVELLPHPELCERFAKALAVVSHGGPSTVMDARMVGRLPIVMARDPHYSEHVDDHQMRFADHMKRHDLAVVVADEQALRDSLDRAIVEPDSFTVPVDGSAITGVVEFGRVMDLLLRTETPLVPASPAGVEELAPGRIENVPGGLSAHGVVSAQSADQLTPAGSDAGRERNHHDS